MSTVEIPAESAPFTAVLLALIARKLDARAAAESTPGDVAGRLREIAAEHRAVAAQIEREGGKT